MSNDVNTIKERKVVLPTWLDALTQLAAYMRVTL